jgi:hypothetical protein
MYVCMYVCMYDKSLRETTLEKLGTMLNFRITNFRMTKVQQILCSNFIFSNMKLFEWLKVRHDISLNIYIFECQNVEWPFCSNYMSSKLQIVE